MWLTRAIARLPLPYRILGTGLALLTVAVSALAAQDTRRTVTIMLRERPDYDPMGVRMGGLRLDPWLNVDTVFDDNIYAANSGEKADLVTKVAPELTLSSDWSRHAIQARLSGEIGFYADNTKEDYADGSASLSGRVDLADDTELGSSVLVERAHIRRGSPDDAGGLNPTLYNHAMAQLRGSKRFNRLTVGLDGQVDRYDFIDTPLIGGAEVNNDDRDRIELRAGAEASWQIVPEYNAFVRAQVLDIGYDSAKDDFGFDRDSHGWQVTAGTRIDLGDVMFGDVFAGYWRRDYDDPALSSISGPTFGASLTWNPTQLTTVTTGVTRQIHETIVPGASGYVATRVDAGVDHELLRNLILSGRAAYEQDAFDGITRDDDIYVAGLSATYLVNRNWRVTLGYQYQRRESNRPGQDYGDNQVTLRVRLAY